jgi:1-pyrroline-2-carboxylate reductase [NAD(P)H]
MQVISAEQVHQSLNFPALTAALAQAFAAPFHMPARQVFHLSEDAACKDAFAVLPSWNQDVIGVKAFTYFPDNGAHQLPSLFSKILLFKRDHGEPLAMVDGTSVTYWRTAAVSALAAQQLARADASRLLLLGTGNLALPLLRAHAALRSLSSVQVWGRDIAKAERIVAAFRAEQPALAVSVVSDLRAAVRQSDIIVAATGSAEPLVLGEDVQAGSHVDLLGNHSPDRRECDTALVEKSAVFVDYAPNVCREAGELLIPVAEGRFTLEQIRADLAACCRGEAGRRDAQEITLFKSVGTALADLVTAHLVQRQQAPQA